VKLVKDVLDPVFFRRAQEEELAIRAFGDCAYLLGFKRPIINCLVANDFIEIGAERVVAEDADGQGRVRIGEGFGRPFDELGKIEKEACLDLVFESLGVLAARLGQPQYARSREANE